MHQCTPNSALKASGGQSCPVSPLLSLLLSGPGNLLFRPSVATGEAHGSAQREGYRASCSHLRQGPEYGGAGQGTQSSRGRHYGADPHGHQASEACSRGALAIADRCAPHWDKTLSASKARHYKGVLFKSARSQLDLLVEPMALTVTQPKRSTIELQFHMDGDRLPGRVTGYTKWTPSLKTAADCCSRMCTTGRTRSVRTCDLLHRVEDESSNKDPEYKAGQPKTKTKTKTKDKNQGPRTLCCARLRAAACSCVTALAVVTEPALRDGVVLSDDGRPPVKRLTCLGGGDLLLRHHCCDVGGRREVKPVGPMPPPRVGLPVNHAAPCHKWGGWLRDGIRFPRVYGGGEGQARGRRKVATARTEEVEGGGWMDGVGFVPRLYGGGDRHSSRHATAQPGEEPQGRGQGGEDQGGTSDQGRPPPPRLPGTRSPMDPRIWLTTQKLVMARERPLESTACPFQSCTRNDLTTVYALMQHCRYVHSDTGAAGRPSAE